MLGFVRKHGSTFVIAIVVSALFAAGPAIAGGLNAKRLNGYRAKQLIRVAENHINNNALLGTAADATVISTTISAPKDGYLVIIASSDVFGSNYSNCWLTLDSVALTASERTMTPDEDNCATDSAWPVAKGTHAVSLMADPDIGDTYDETTIEVLYVPFGATGSVPVPVAPAAAVAKAGN